MNCLVEFRVDSLIFGDLHRRRRVGQVPCDDQKGGLQAVYIRDGEFPVRSLLDEVAVLPEHSELRVRCLDKERIGAERRQSEQQQPAHAPHQLTTRLTILRGTMITFRIVFPSMNEATCSKASSFSEASSISGETLTRDRSFPLTCTGISISVSRAN